MCTREISPLSGKEVTLKNDKFVKIYTWFNNKLTSEKLLEYKLIIDEYLNSHPNQTIDDNNILVAQEIKTGDILLVHILDIVGYVKDTVQ